jgi:hypothetical protein
LRACSAEAPAFCLARLPLSFSCFIPDPADCFTA